MKLSEAGWLWRAISLLCVCWLAFAALEAALLLGLPETALRHPQIPVGARMTLLFHAWTALGVWLLVIGAPFCALMSWWAARGYGGVVAWVCFFCIAPVVMLYGISWGSFWSAGGFLNRDSLEFWVIQPIQVMHWVPPVIFYGLPVLVIASVAAACAWVPRLLDRMSSAGERRLRVFVTVALVLSFALQLWGQQAMQGARQLVSEPIVGVRFVLGDLYAQVRRERSGAFAHALHGIADPDVDWSARHAPDRSLPVLRRPLTAIDEWAAGIDRGELRRFNVILVLVESLRADQLRIYGGSRDVMPATDALAAGSQVFLRAYTQATHSNYADMGPLSGHYPLRSIQTHVYPKNPTYPRVMIYDVLKALGWRTAIFSSQNEHWGKMINYLDTGTLDRFLHAESWDGPTYISKTDTGFAAWVSNTEHAGSIDDRYTVDEAIKWMTSDPEHPFFFYMNLQNSHFPYVVPEGFERPFGPDSIDFRMTFNRYPKNKIPIVKDLYADSLNYADQQLARLFGALEAEGLAENTIVVLSGDTGQAFFEHGFASHGNALYNEVMHVPLLMRVPGMEPALRGQPAQHIDVPSTVAGVLGFPPHPAWQGVDLLGEPVAHRDIFLVAQTPIAHQYAIVRDGLKLIYDPRIDRSFLYDLNVDPDERRDLAAARPEVLRTLSDRLHTWRRLQTDYYANPIAQKTWYPPVLDGR